VSLFTHALNIGGFGLPPVLRMPRAGHTVTRVQWDGCMATERNEQAPAQRLKPDRPRSP
jgi:hypothetical protein